MKYLSRFNQFIGESSNRFDTDLSVKGAWQEDRELMWLVWDFILDPEGDSLWFKQKDCERIIELAKKYPDLKRESLNYIRKKGGILYRGLKDDLGDDDLATFDKNGNYVTGKHKPLDSFTVDKKTSLEFSHNQWLIQVPLSEVESHVVLSVDVLLNGMKIPEKHLETIKEYWGGELGESQYEILLSSDLRISKKFIKPTNKDQVQAVRELVKFIRKEYGEKASNLYRDGNSTFIVWVDGCLIRMLGYDPGVLNLMKGHHVGREKSNSEKYPEMLVEKELEVRRKAENTDEWINKLKNAIRDFIT